MTSRTYHDVGFGKYLECGAYHWKELSNNLISHHAFTAERCRRVIAAIEPLGGKRILDYGCGDGALFPWLRRKAGGNGELHGYEPNREGFHLATRMISSRGMKISLHSEVAQIPNDYFDAVICSEVIEHVYDVPDLLAQLSRVLKVGGKAVITTPVRLTEVPEDPNHIREWFPSEFRSLFENTNLRLIHYCQFIPAAAPEVYYWRPLFLFRLPLFRILCNVLSIYGGFNALSWLRMRPRLFMEQMAILENAR